MPTENFTHYVEAIDKNGIREIVSINYPVQVVEIGIRLFALMMNPTQANKPWGELREILRDYVILVGEYVSIDEI